MLDDIRTVLLKRAFIELKPMQLNPGIIDELLAEHYGQNWKKVYGTETQAKKMTPYTGKSQQEINEEFEKKKKK